MKKYPTIDLLKDALSKRGYRVEEEQLGNRPYTRFTAPNGRLWLTQNARIGYPFLSVAVSKIAAQKDLSYELCEKHGIRIPKTLLIKDLSTSSIALQGLLATGSVVIKPNNASLSNGLTLNVTNFDELQLAYLKAKAYSDFVIAQEQVEGEEIRFAMIDGKARAALLRETPRLVGDGTSTLQELLDAENEVRKTLKFSDHTQYPLLTSEIIDLKRFDLSSIPADKEVVELSRTTMVRYGASMYNVLDQIHPDYIAVAEKAATEFGARFIAVDIMIKDMTAPATDDHAYAFIEFNASPVLTLFYCDRNGKQYDVVPDLVKLIDATLEVTKS